VCGKQDNPTEATPGTSIAIWERLDRVPVVVTDSARYASENTDQVRDKTRYIFYRTSQGKQTRTRTDWNVHRPHQTTQTPGWPVGT